MFEPHSITGGTAQCAYCNSHLSLPDQLRGQPARVISQVEIHVGPQVGANIGKWIWLAVVLPILLVLFGVLAAVLGVLAPIIHSVSSIKSPSSPVAPGGPSGGRTANTPPGFASEVLKFGSEGIGPGMMTDARSIAVDGDGNIYVAEYTGGRVQVFNSAGKFTTQWMVDTKMPLRSMVADRKGTVYIAQSGNITRYAGDTGTSLGQMQYAEGWGFDDMTLAADGGLVCSWYKNRDDIVRFNSQGQVVRKIPAAISTASGDSELDTHVAVDGLDNIYALGTFNNGVFKFGPDGKFLTRFGSAGDKPGQFRAAQAIAVDGKGRVYVSDFKGVQVFDSDGRYVNVFKPDGVASGMVFNDKGELFIAARNKVIKLVLNE